MKALTFIYLILANVATAQPVLKALYHDAHRSEKKQYYFDKKQRTENTIVVQASVGIKVQSGNNPRCTGDTGPIVIESEAVNATGATYEWYNKNVKLSNTDTKLTWASPQVGDSIYCVLNVISDCVKNKKTKSNAIIIQFVNTISSSVTLAVTGGNNPACAANTPLTVTAITKDAGINPKYKWYYKNVQQTLPDNQNFFAKDSITSGNQIYCTITPDVACAVSNSVNSAPITRSAFRSLIASTDIAITKVNGEDCANKLYYVTAKSQNAGASPIYGWYINGNLVNTTLGNTYATPLKSNIDEIYATMQSSLSCANPKITASNTIIVTDTLVNLPFFDEFSTYLGQPDIKKWEKQGGTYVNNSYTLSPPSANAATFDGLKWNGTPYDSVNISTSGPTDKLVTLPLDLSSFENKDSLYFSFYWQFQGNGNRPEISANDRLALLFKTANGDWAQVWEMTSANALNERIIPINNATPPYTVSGFNQKTVAILNGSNTYLHNGFQAMFQSYGKVSGNFDIWNVDYVYINKNESRVILFNDLNFGKTPPSIITPYSSMPFNIYKKYAQKYTNPNISTAYNKLGNQQFFFNLSANIYDKLKNKYITTILPSSTEAADIDEVLQKNVTSQTIDYVDIKAYPEKNVELQTQFIIATDVDNLDGKNIPYTLNNTITGTTIMDNFYAYDDGSSEYGIAINQKLGYVSYKFVIPEPDTLQEIAISFLRSGKIIVNQTFNLYIANQLTSPINFTQSPLHENILYRKNYPITYPTGVDHFVVFALDNKVAVKDSFFVVLQQLSDDQLVIGWDKNTDSRSHIKYNLSNSPVWDSYTLSGGSMMVRPANGVYRYLTSEAKDNVQYSAVQNQYIYPNPTAGKVYTNFEYDNMKIIDMTGIAHQLHIQNSDNEIDISHLPNGMYMLIFETRKKIIYKKIVKN
ncbi:MAG: T9SS type A sorting domain-containing protein [Cytophagales bacterium]|nr:T9SS type A sorting domain-containing protein [Cytophagales bacterium]